MDDRTRKTEQLFQVKFSDFPIRSPDTARNCGKSPIFYAQKKKPKISDSYDFSIEHQKLAIFFRRADFRSAILEKDF